MKVRILQWTTETQRLGAKGMIVECGPALGNYLAGVGQVEIIEHDKPTQAGGELIATPEALRHLERETGRQFLPGEEDEVDDESA